MLGHHPHVLQGREYYGNGLVVYSLGNFVFDLDQDDLAQLGAGPFQTNVLYVTLTKDAVTGVRIEPVVIDPVEGRPRPATASEAAEIQDRLGDLDALAGP